MNFWGVLKLVTLKDVWQLLKLLLRFPLFAVPTLSATLNCIRLSNKFFGRTHHKNNAANAFRHAVWNYLIIVECNKWTNKQHKTIEWAKLITDWHENFSPNKDLARAMDLHNNQVGRNVYSKNGAESLEGVITQIKEMVPHSKKISNKEEMENYTGRLVHIVD